MITHSGNGWLTTLADLSIILFMVTAADLSNAQVASEARESSSAMVATAEPVAIYRPGADAGSLGEWLAQQADDPRQHLTIMVRHRSEGMKQAMDAGLDLARQAETAGWRARIIAEESEQDELMVQLAYDSSPKEVARKLLSAGD